MTDTDLVIPDSRLPDIGSYVVARHLRGDRRTAEIPIIFLLEERDCADRHQGLEIGADDYITKPFDVQELRLRVRNAVSGKLRARFDQSMEYVYPIKDRDQIAKRNDRLGIKLAEISSLNTLSIDVKEIKTELVSLKK